MHTSLFKQFSDVIKETFSNNKCIKKRNKKLFSYLLLILIVLIILIIYSIQKNTFISILSISKSPC